MDLAPRKPAGTVYDAWHVTDYLKWARCAPDEDRPDLIIGNPPFNLAEEFIRASLGLIAGGGRVAFLLRLGLLETQKRADLWRAYPPARVSVLIQRPSFTGDGNTDAAAYGIFLWTSPAPRSTALDWLSWQPERRSRRSIARA